MRIGIDLLWVRPGINGGTEAVIRNLMTGFGLYISDQEYLLFVAKDNADSFRKYEEYPNMKIEICDVFCANQAKRSLWENLHLDRLAGRLGVDLMFIPVYSMPLTYGSGIPYVCVIHDLQALHYPQYFSVSRKLFFKFMWRRTCTNASRVITISEYCKQDLTAHYPVVKENCLVIYDPVETAECTLPAKALEQKYDIRPNEYFYCVSSMLPHKNLDTLLQAMELRKKKGLLTPLVLSGVGGDTESFDSAVERLDIGDVVINTGFVSNEERDCLYENCRLFLFPSVFEGFGMPPVEAMRRGRRVVMTRESCLGEVTEGKAVYVDEPRNAQEWVSRIAEAMELPAHREAFPQYEVQCVAERYAEVFRSLNLIYTYGKADEGRGLL